MDPRNAIEIKNISKSFRIEVEDPEKTVSILNRTPTKTVERKVIDSISLNIRKGDVIGILGRNGSGKSTLLSLIAEIMKPDSGTIEHSGKIVTILELGMGFHKDMSGRENIYLKGELYGFSRSQIDERIDTIIEYSGIKEYIDNPVRTYSSGMSGRLAFAIMVSVDAEIMLVDEILSVGDTTFSTKAKEHFKKMATSGKTVIFVSHNIDFVESFCTRAVWLDKGKIIKDGPAKKICAEYRNKMNDSPEVISDLAIAGVPDSQYKLGLLYRDGGTFGQSEELYEKWIGEAAIHGHTRAQVEYANILISKGEIEEAASYYNMAAAKGDAEAKNRASELSIPKSFGVEQLIDVFKQMAESGNCLNEYRCATLLLKAAWSNEDRVEAFNMFVRAANDGSPEAINQVAMMYRDGTGIPKDLKKMEEYYQKGVDFGYVPSMIALGDIYTQGKLLPRDENKAFDNILKAAKLGDSNSMYKVANLYKDGIGVQPSKDKSDYWFDKYVKTMYSQHRLWAVDYIRSGSVKTDCNVIDLFKDVADTSNSLAMINLIPILQLENKPVDQYLDELQFKAENHNVDAIRRIGTLYYDGAGVDRDYSVALRWYTVASDLGDSWSKNRLAEMYRDGKGTDIDLEKAISLYFELAKQGNTNALANLITIATSSPSFYSTIFDRALKMLINIAYSGNLDAIKRVGNLYYDGVGVAKDYSEASYWYKKASILGDNWAKNRLAEMYRDGKVSEVEIEDHVMGGHIIHESQRLSADDLNSDQDPVEGSINVSVEGSLEPLSANIDPKDDKEEEEQLSLGLQGDSSSEDSNHEDKNIPSHLGDEKQQIKIDVEGAIQTNQTQIQPGDQLPVTENKSANGDMSANVQLYRYQNGSSYKGALDDNGRFSGFGVYTYPNGDRFEGEFVAGIKEGDGCYYWKDGSWTKGVYVKGVRQGPTVVFTTNNGWTYEGNMVNDQFVGNIRITYDGRPIYEGGCKDMRPNGDGVMYFRDGHIVGHWSPDGKCKGLFYGNNGMTSQVDPNRRFI